VLAQELMERIGLVKKPTPATTGGEEDKEVRRLTSAATDPVTTESPAVPNPDPRHEALYGPTDPPAVPDAQPNAEAVAATPEAK